jgi:hypothetical protein
MASRLAQTVGACVVCCVSYTVSNVAQTYWLTAGGKMSLYGQFVFFLVAITTVAFALLAALAARLGDCAVLLPDDDAAERRLFCCTLCAPRRAARGVALLGDGDDAEDAGGGGGGDGDAEAAGGGGGGSLNARTRARAARRFACGAWSRTSQTELLFLLGVSNASASLLQWYATPPTREPPLLNAVLPALAIVFAVPLSRALLGDEKRYCAAAPLLALGAIAAGLGVGLLPAALAGGGGGGAAGASAGAGESPGDVLAWTLVNAASQVPSAGALVGAQAYLSRAARSARARGAEPRGAAAAAVLRFVAYNQLGVGAGVAAGWWLDVVPWFGSGQGARAMGEGVAFAFDCSLRGAAAGGGCAAVTPLWALLGVLPYAAYLAAVAVVSADSAVFGNVVLVAQAALQAAFFLIPGTNPDAGATPLWSTLASVALTLAGVALFKRWELGAQAAAGEECARVASFGDADAAPGEAF